MFYGNIINDFTSIFPYMEFNPFVVHNVFIIVHLNCLYTFVQFAVECIVILFMLQIPYAFSLLQNSV
jgi:hypothetical protein